MRAGEPNSFWVKAENSPAVSARALQIGFQSMARV